MDISNMDMLAKDNIVSMFSEEVQSFLIEKDVTFTPVFTIRGKSGFDFSFDFQIAGKKSELAIKTFGNVKQNTIGNYLFCLTDTKKIREEQTGKEFRSLAVINDLTSKPSEKVIDAMRTYGSEVLLWSERVKQENNSLFQVA